MDFVAMPTIRRLSQPTFLGATRYFGGILLGGGGLVRAYSHSAKLAVDAAERLVMCRCVPVNVTVDYNIYGKIGNVISEFEAKILDTDFAENVTVKLIVKKNFAEKFIGKITDITNGAAEFEQLAECYENFA